MDSETVGQLLTRLGTDGRAWAREFLDRYHGEEVGATVDEGLLISWFANAIEAGRSAGYWARIRDELT